MLSATAWVFRKGLVHDSDLPEQDATVTRGSLVDARATGAWSQSLRRNLAEVGELAMVSRARAERL